MHIGFSKRTHVASIVHFEILRYLQRWLAGLEAAAVGKKQMHDNIDIVDVIFIDLHNVVNRV